MPNDSSPYTDLECDQAIEIADLRRKLSDARDVMQMALEHVTELRDAWERGAISEHDGRGGTRSNRNVRVEVALRKEIEGMENLKHGS